MKKFFVGVVLLVLCFTCTATMPLEAEGNSQTLAECSNGKFNGFVSDDVVTWLGVPYAKAPTGSLRWKAPEAPEKSSSTFEADKFSAMPIQEVSQSNAASLMTQDEDCLYLNVWKASADNAALRPVMVWIHGGSFRANGTAEPEWLGNNLASDHPDIMVVSVGFRLGFMGFIDFSQVSGGSDFPDSGNLGILDILQSLKWMRENISAFGGDPDNITLFGQSSGAAMISLLMTMEEAQGLFKRAIIQSGSVSMSMPESDAADLAQTLLSETGKSDMAGLMSLTTAELKAVTSNAKVKSVLNFPELDGVNLTSGDIYEAFAKNAGNYDVLIGSNADEARYFLAAVGGDVEVFGGALSAFFEGLTSTLSSIPGGEALLDLINQFIALQGDTESVWAYTEFLNELLFRVPAINMASSRTGSGNTYMYYWNIPSAASVLGACHASELPYVLDIPGVLVPDVILNSETGQQVRQAVQGMWVDFAKDGVIDARSEYTPAGLETIIISADANLVTEAAAPKPEQIQLITPLVQNLRISGREIINSLSAGTTTDDEPDTTDEPAGVSSSSGGCNNSGMLPFVFVLFLIPAAMIMKRH